jgi:hypothetical protein
MENQSDHDLLIQVNTKLEMLIAQNNQYLDQHSKLLERVVTIEIERGRDSERIKSIQQDIDDLRKKSTLVDAINAGVAAIAGVIGFIFGGK